VLVRKNFPQRQLLTYTANMQTALIGLEACSGAHFLGRELRKQGHDVRLIAAQFVRPFVKSNKNDFVDVEAIAEAVERKNMRFVPIKTDDHLDLQAIHRVRDRLITRRTAVINQLRAFLLERGMVDRPHRGITGSPLAIDGVSNARVYNVCAYQRHEGRSCAQKEQETHLPEDRSSSA